MAHLPRGEELRANIGQRLPLAHREWEGKALHIEKFAADGYTHTVLLSAMSRDEVEADQLASQDLDGPQHRSAFSTAALRSMRRGRSLGQAVATGECAGQAIGAEGVINKLCYKSGSRGRPA